MTTQLQEVDQDTLPKAALACAVLGLLASVLMYWLVVPGIVFGVAAVVLGWRARKRGQREFGSVALALGIVAILLVPSTLSIAASAEDWGRDCALNPEMDPNC